jgi:hypothetical protein
MPENAQRFVGGALGFALAVVWIVAGLGAAAICLIAAGVGFGLAIARQRIEWRRLAGGVGSTRTRIESAAAARAQRVARSRKPAPARHAPRPARRREVQRPRTPLAADPGSYGW